MSKTKLTYYKTSEGIYLAKEGFNYNKVRNSIDNTLRYNEGIELQDTHHQSWKYLKGCSELNKIEKKSASVKVNIRWELKNIEDVKLGLPEVLSPKEALEEWDDDDDVYDYVITNPEYSRFNNLYTRKWDTKEGDWVDITDQFDITCAGEFSVDNVSEDYSDMKVSMISKSGWTDKESVTNIASIATYSELEKMLVPDLLIHKRPCKVDIDTTYKIVRNYIKNNIDYACAKVTSDYDFCFTVKRIIKIKPYVHKTEIKKSNGRSYAKPRFNERTIESKMETIFEMRPSKRYQGYTPIKGFRGDNLADLANNIKTYLEELMEYINTPLKECEHCKGTGCVPREYFDKNEGRE